MKSSGKSSGKRTFIKIIVAFVVTLLILYLNFFLGFIALVLFFVYVFNIAKAGIYSNIGTIKYSRGNLDKAIIWYKRACKCKKVKPNIVVSLAYLLLKSGRVDEAEKILKSLDMNKIGSYDKILVTSNMALVMWKKDNLDEAISLLEEFSKEVTNTTILGSLGYFLILKGDLDKALEFNLNAYKYNSSDEVIKDNLAQNYFLLGDNAKAEELYEKAMTAKIKPTFPAAYYNYSLVLIELGKYEKALEYLKKASTFKLSFLSSVTNEQIEEKIAVAEKGLNASKNTLLESGEN